MASQRCLGLHRRVRLKKERSMSVPFLCLFLRHADGPELAHIALKFLPGPKAGGFFGAVAIVDAEFAILIAGKHHEMAGGGEDAGLDADDHGNAGLDLVGHIFFHLGDGLHLKAQLLGAHIKQVPIRTGAF